MTVETLLGIAVPFTVILGPLFASLFGIFIRLGKIEQRLDGDKERLDETLRRHDRHIHEIRNSLQLISLSLARKGIETQKQENQNEDR